MLRRRLIDLEREMRAMGERVGNLEREVDVLKVEKEAWKNAYNDLHEQIAINDKKAEEAEVKVKELKEGKKED